MQWNNCAGPGEAWSESRGRGAPRGVDRSNAGSTGGFGRAQLALLLGSMVAACMAFGCGDACSSANDKLNSCGLGLDAGDNSSLSCDAFTACKATCVNNATCVEIQYQYPKPPFNNYALCLQNCDGK